MTDQRVTPTSSGPGAVGWRAGGDFATGVGFLVRGLWAYARNPRLMLLGLIPALISGALVTAGVVTVVFFAGDLAGAVTPFADDWTGWLRSTVRVFAEIAVVGVALLLAVLVFTALTLLIGEPFYEAISRRVEEQLGGVPGEVDVPLAVVLGRSIVDSLRLLVFTALAGIPLFVAGFIPIVGQSVVPVLAALVGGWALALELTGVPFERRGLRLRDRRKALRGRRSMALGFGAATFVCFLVPLGAIIVMPAAVAGATLMTRRLFGLPDTAQRSGEGR